MFGIPNSIVFSRRLMYRSKFSGFISFGIYLILLVVLIIQLQNMFYK